MFILLEYNFCKLSYQNTGSWEFSSFILIYVCAYENYLSIHITQVSEIRPVHQFYARQFTLDNLFQEKHVTTYK